MARHHASMSMKSIVLRGSVLRDASGAHRSTCTIRMWFDHRKLADPSVHPARIIEIIWEIYGCALIVIERIFVIAISLRALRITRFPQSTIKEFIERRLNRIVIMTIFCR